MSEDSNFTDLPHGAWMDNEHIYITTIPGITVHVPIEYFNEFAESIEHVNDVVQAIIGNLSTEMAEG